MGAHFLMRFSGFALEISSSLTRLLHVCANCFMCRPAAADFPEGAIQFCARIVDVSTRSVVQGPAVGELHGGGDHTLARELQFVKKAILILQSPIEVFLPDPQSLSLSKL